MKAALIGTAEPRALGDEPAGLLTRFRAASGIELRSINPTLLPQEVLALAVTPPEELLRRPGLSRRTRNALERATKTPSGCWTVEDLMALRGFGFAALLEVLESARPRPAVVRSLNEELRELLLMRKPPRGKVVAPALERSLALIAADLPASEDDIVARLDDEGLLSGPVFLAEIQRAARFLSAAPAFAVVRRPGLVVAVPVAVTAAVETALRMALRALASKGAANLHDLCGRFEEGVAAMIRRILRAHRAFRWLDQQGGWFCLGEPLPSGAA